jgi:hypothetical protein
MPKVAEVLCKSLKTRLPMMADEVSGGLLDKAWFGLGDFVFRVSALRPAGCRPVFKGGATRTFPFRGLGQFRFWIISE